MNKNNNQSRQNGKPTTTTEAKSRDDNYYLLSNTLNFSETERGICRRMNECTPANELIIRGWQ